MTEPRRPFGADSSGNWVDDRLADFAAKAAEHRETLARPAGSAGPWGAPPPAPRGRGASRRHAAKGSRLAALALSLFTTFGLGAYLAQSTRSSGSSIPLAAPPTTTAPVPTTTTSPSSGNTSGSSSNGSSNDGSGSGTASRSLQDGTFTGSTSSNKYGNVQVQVVDTNGKIAQVEIVQYPDRDRKSVDINNDAIPQLISETLQAQSANVDSVSGATYTSASYEQSLQSAIDQARTGTAST
jgi:uncharacterized protein with FMN-binding domain